jgi:hypothetical protein
MKPLFLLSLIIFSIAYPKVDTSLIQVGNRWEYSKTSPYFKGGCDLSILSKRRSGDSLTFEIQVRDSTANGDTGNIVDAKFTYAIISGELIKPPPVRGDNGSCMASKPLFYFGGESGGSTSTVNYRNEVRHLTRWTGDPDVSPQGMAWKSEGWYLEKAGMIYMYIGWFTPMSYGAYDFALSRFNGGNVDTAYIFSQEALPLVQPRTRAKANPSPANDLLLLGGNRYHVDGKRVSPSGGALRAASSQPRNW